MNYSNFLKYINTHDLCSNRMGVRVLSIGKGTASASLTLTDNSRNLMGSMHGGALATLADVTAGCCVVHHNRLCVTLDFTIHYLKGIPNGTVTAIATEIHSGKHLSVCRVEIKNANDELCCTASVTMYLTDTGIEDMIDPKDREALELI